MFPDEFSRADGIFQRICPGGVLLGFHHHITLIACFRQYLKNWIKFHTTVAGDGESALPDTFQEAEPLLPHPLDYIRADILEMDMLNAVCVPLFIKYNLFELLRYLRYMLLI